MDILQNPVSAFGVCQCVFCRECITRLFDCSCFMPMVHRYTGCLTQTGSGTIQPMAQALLCHSKWLREKSTRNHRVHQESSGYSEQLSQQVLSLKVTSCTGCAACLGHYPLKYVYKTIHIIVWMRCLYFPKCAKELVVAEDSRTRFEGVFKY